MIVELRVDLEPKNPVRAGDIADQLKRAVNSEAARLFKDNWLDSVALAKVKTLEEE
jgi:hypothetical protein